MVLSKRMDGCSPNGAFFSVCQAQLTRNSPKLSSSLPFLLVCFHPVPFPFLFPLSILKGSQPSREGPEQASSQSETMKFWQSPIACPWSLFFGELPLLFHHVNVISIVLLSFSILSSQTIGIPRLVQGLHITESWEVQRFCDLALQNAESLYAQRFITPARVQPFKIESSLNPEKRNPQRSNV